MSRLHFHIFLMILLTIVTPVLLGQVIVRLIPAPFVSIPLHSVLEATGGMIAIVISMIVYVKYRREAELTHFNISTAALLAMGIIDIFHASMMPGELFVWLHSIAVFFGGLLFTGVWLREQRVSYILYDFIPVIFVVLPITVSFLSILFSQQLPVMLNTDMSFTVDANWLNMIGGAGFFIASVRFVTNYLKNGELDELLFAGHTMLFGIAGVLFVSSMIWDMQWWLWHVLRLTAYAIAFYFLYREYRREIGEVETTNEKLARKSAELNDYFKIVDANVITSSTDPAGVITKVSRAFCEISGYSSGELIGRCHSIVRHPDMPRELYRGMWATIRAGEVWYGELKNRKKDGSAYWVDVTITPQYDGAGSISGYTAIRHDITDKKLVEQLSITDPLTELYNRRHFSELISREIFRARRDEKFFAFLIMDVDHFKQYNDLFGHQRGDDILQAIGKVLKESAARASDFAFRLGGEEFGMLFSGLDATDSVAFAGVVRERIEGLKFAHPGNSASPYVTVSMGLIVRKGKAIPSADELFKIADDALYEAKERGRNQIVLHRT